MNHQAVIGPPGTGKTTWLIDKAIEAIKAGSTTDKIGFVSYTRRASKEGAERIRRSCPDVAGRFPWFSTVHSFVFRNIEVGNDRILSPNDKDLERFMKDRLGYGLNSKHGRDVGKLYSLSRVADMSYEDMALKIFAPRLPPCSSEALNAFSEAYDQFKKENRYVDFDDLLDEFLRGGHVPALDLFCIDEAQDLTTKLWRVVERISSRASRVCLAGDNDQMLYAWAGADDGAFERHFDGAVVLNQSSRCARRVAAKAEEIIRPVRTIERQWFPTKEEGTVEWVNKIESVPLSQPGSWFILCRTNARVEHISGELKERLIHHAVVHHGRTRFGYSTDMAKLLKWWRRLVIDKSTVRRSTMNWALKVLGRTEEVTSETVSFGAVPDLPLTLAELINRPLYELRIDDCEYVRRLVSFGVDVLSPPNILVMTINQAKGSEADHVVVDTYASRKVRGSFQYTPGPETRQAYVAVTRARKSVYLLTEGGHLECYDW